MVSIKKIIIGKMSAIERRPLTLSSTVPPASIVYPAGSFFSNSASAGASCALTVFASMPASRHALVQAELVLSNAVFDRQLLANARFAVAQAGQRGNPGFATARSWRMSVESLAHEVRAEARGYSP